MLVGPSGTGKSTAALWRIHSICLKVPGVQVLLVRKTLKSLGGTTLTTFRKEVLGPDLILGHEPYGGKVAYFGGSVSEPAAFRYANGSQVVVGGMDNPTKIMSAAYDIIFADEALELTEDDWEHLQTRLRSFVLSWQQAIGALNPGPPTHWIKRRADRGALTLLESRHEDNPTYVNEDGTLTSQGEVYLGRLGDLTGVRRLRYFRGIWAAAEGVIYEDFDPSVHVIDPFPIPDDWQRWWSVDFGFVHPLVLQCWAEDHDGRLYLYRELYRSQRLVEDHAKDILRIVSDRETPGGKWTEPKPRAVICDHDAEDRATLERHLGMPTRKAHKTVRDGIQLVQGRLRRQGDGKPRLFFFRDALVELDRELRSAGKPTCTVEELPSYVWQPPTGDRPAKEQPLKVNDDGADALRYMVAERSINKRPGVRWLG